MSKTTSAHPEWATRHRKEGTELRLIKGRYYLYAYKTVYDKQSHKPKKISGQILGSITEKDGFIPSAKRNLENQASRVPQTPIYCKEYGVSSLIASALKLYSKNLSTSFAEDWAK